ncbi:MAG: manganese efflux pump MntP family protein [Rivularia sp. (in: cyanobacteria)]
MGMIFIGLGLAADACAVALSSGMVIKHIKLNKALKIALFFGIFQGLMLLIGLLIGLSFRELLSRVDHWIAFGLLTFLGGKLIYESIQVDTNRKPFNPLDFYTLLGLAIATSIDALAVGISLSVLQTPIISSAILVGLITFSISFVAVYIGHRFGDLFKNKIEIIGGLVLIFLGSKILFEHLIQEIVF